MSLFSNFKQDFTHAHHWFLPYDNPQSNIRLVFGLVAAVTSACALAFSGVGAMAVNGAFNFAAGFLIETANSTAHEESHHQPGQLLHHHASLQPVKVRTGALRHHHY